MTALTITNDILSICDAHGIDEVGACSISQVAHDETCEKLNGLMPGVSTVLVVLKRVVDNGIERAHDILYQKAALQTFDVLCAACEAIISHSTAFGLKAFWPGRQKTPFQKDLAIAAGLGSRSICGLFISHQQGIDVHLETVLLGFQLQINQKNKQPVYVCDACGLCLDACPAGALDGNVGVPSAAVCDG